VEALLIHFGINLTDVFAAFAGGTVAALVIAGPRPDPWGIFCLIAVGTLTGAYLGPVLPLYIGAKPSTGATFVVGLGGMPICKVVLAGLRRVKWSPATLHSDSSGQDNHRHG
jgi:hypothetical protein